MRAICIWSDGRWCYLEDSMYYADRDIKDCEQVFVPDHWDDTLIIQYIHNYLGV